MVFVKRVALVLLGLIVVVAAGASTRHHFRVVRHKWRVQAIEDGLYEDVFVDFGGGAPVEVWHGNWGGWGIGERAGDCLQISRHTKFRVVDPLGVDGLAVEAERVAGYLEGEGWEVHRLRSDDADLLDPPASARLFRIRSVRDSETVHISFLRTVALMITFTNNCGQPAEIVAGSRGGIPEVESFTP